MQDREFLQEVIQTEALSALENHYNNKKKVILKEDQQIDTPLTINNVPEDLIIINIDKHFQNKDFLSGEKGICKRCDYLLISEAEKVALFIEMKTGNNVDPKDAINQLKGGKCVFEYIKNIGKEFYDQPVLEGYEERYILFKKMKEKRRTKIEKHTKSHDTPATVMRISSRTTCQFLELL